MNDHICIATALNNRMRVYAAVTTETVEEARKRHDLSPIASAALGRTLTATVIMASWLKSENNSITIQINGRGPLGRIVTVSDPDANVRGYVENPYVETVEKEKGKLDVAFGVIGDIPENMKSKKDLGYISVIRDMGLKDPYIGLANLVSGEIGEDFAHYLALSEQILSVVALGVLIEKDLSIKAAGGFIIQLMPGATEEDVSYIETRIKNIPSVTGMLNDGMTPEDILRDIFEDINVMETRECRFKCSCSREKMERNLMALGKDEISAMIEEQDSAELICHFCNERYMFSKEEFTGLLTGL